MLALDIGFKTVLTAAATLATGGWHQLDAPQGTSPPYGIFKEASDTGMYNFGNVLAADHVFYFVTGVAVDANESGVVTAAKIADQVKAGCTNPVMTVTGKTVLSCRFDRSFPPLKEWDDTNQRFVYSRPVLIEAWLS